MTVNTLVRASLRGPHAATFWLLCGLVPATCFGVFVLPFLVPPPVLPIVSAANAAGFNNRIAAVSLACLSVVVFLVSLRKPVQERAGHPEECGPLSRRAIVIVCLCPVLLSAFLCLCVVMADARYVDFSYFIEQIQKHEQYGRQLYRQIEFPYGPLLFYGPEWIRWILSPLRVSTRSAYIVTLLLEELAGGLLLAWVMEQMAITRKLKLIFLVFCVIGWFYWGLGLNYTMFRYTAPLAMVTYAVRQKSAWRFSAATMAGEILCLSISPEMGFAFMSATAATGVYFGVTRNRRWGAGVIASFAGSLFFFLIMGADYLRMLNQFAKGVYNFVVEPTPYVLIFVAAVVWIVPVMLARAFASHSDAFARMGAIYVFSLALLPVAFGRADAAHIFYNGIGIYVLSMAAVSALGYRWRAGWLVCVAVASFFPLWVGLHNHRQLKTIFMDDALALDGYGIGRSHPHFLQRRLPSVFSRLREASTNGTSADRGLDTAGLERIIGSAPIAAPVEVPNGVEIALKRSGHYVPLFYDFQIAILDRSAEEREIRELRQYQWILTPGDMNILQRETPESTAGPLGFKLPYVTRNEPYVAGQMLLDELSTHWQVAGRVNGYAVYHRNP